MGQDVRKAHLLRELAVDDFHLVCLEERHFPPHWPTHQGFTETRRRTANALSKMLTQWSPDSFERDADQIRHLITRLSPLAD
jgi:hypothetical protein